MNDPGMGHFKEPLKDFATLGLSLPCVKWLHGGHPRTEERGGDIITLRHPPSLLSWMQVLVDTPRGGLAAPESNLMIDLLREEVRLSSGAEQEVRKSPPSQ